MTAASEPVVAKRRYPGGLKHQPQEHEGGGAGVAEDGFSLQPATAAPFIAAAIGIMVLAFII
ncbi:hypothetical protein M8494_10390 [Serratia ureilytica]